MPRIELTEREIAGVLLRRLPPAARVAALRARGEAARAKLAPEMLASRAKGVEAARAKSLVLQRDRATVALAAMPAAVVAKVVADLAPAKVGDVEAKPRG